MCKTMYILFSEDGYKNLFSLDFCKENNIKILPVSCKINGITRIDSAVTTLDLNFSDISDIHIGENVLSMIFDEAVSNKIENIVVLCPDGRFFSLKSDVQAGIRNYKRTSNSEKINIKAFDTKMLSVGVGALLKKSIELNIPVEHLSANAKTFVIDNKNNGSFYIKGNTISDLNDCDCKKIITKCRNYINKNNLDYTVSSINSDNIEKIVGLINKNCYFTSEYGIISGSKFQEKTIISVF